MTPPDARASSAPVRDPRAIEPPEIAFLDPALAAIRERVLAGGRRGGEDGLACLETWDLPALGQMANHVARRRHGDRVHFVLNRQLNPTNICVLDCGFCDESFIRQEMTYVDYVRDREVAHVHVLVTRQNTGAGGEAHTFDLIGRGTFQGMDYSTVYTTNASATDAEMRDGFLRTLQAALVALNERMRHVLALRFGLNGEKPA